MLSPLPCPGKRHVKVQLRYLKHWCLSPLGNKLPKKRQRDDPSLSGFRKWITWQEKWKMSWENTKPQPMPQAFAPPQWGTALTELRKPSAGMVGCVPRLPHRSPETPTLLSKEVQLPASPAARASACCLLYVLPALPQHCTFHLKGGAFTKVAPNPTLNQYDCNHFDHTSKLLLASQHKVCISWEPTLPQPALGNFVGCVLLSLGPTVPSMMPSQFFSPDLVSSGGDLLQKLLRWLLFSSLLVAQQY